MKRRFRPMERLFSGVWYSRRSQQDADTLLLLHELSNMIWGYANGVSNANVVHGAFRDNRWT